MTLFVPSRVISSVPVDAAGEDRAGAGAVGENRAGLSAGLLGHSGRCGAGVMPSTVTRRLRSSLSSCTGWLMSRLAQAAHG